MELEELAAEIPHRLCGFRFHSSLHKDLPSFLLSVRQCGPFLSPTKFELAIAGSEGSSPIMPTFILPLGDWGLASLKAEFLVILAFVVISRKA
jgi:hypothetical protein